MAKSKTIRSKGKGWFRESLRHSRARKYGRAGGIYKLKFLSSNIDRQEQTKIKNSILKNLKKHGIKVLSKGKERIVDKEDSLTTKAAISILKLPDKKVLPKIEKWIDMSGNLKESKTIDLTELRDVISAEEIEHENGSNDGQAQNN